MPPRSTRLLTLHTTPGVNGDVAPHTSSGLCLATCQQCQQCHPSGTSKPGALDRQGTEMLEGEMLGAGRLPTEFIRRRDWRALPLPADGGILADCRTEWWAKHWTPRRPMFCQRFGGNTPLLRQGFGGRALLPQDFQGFAGQRGATARLRPLAKAEQVRSQRSQRRTWSCNPPMFCRFCFAMHQSKGLARGLMGSLRE